MVSEIHLVRESQTCFEVGSVVPFRCLMVATIPAENNVIRVESIELRATCPDGWHESPVFYASQSTTEVN